MITDSHIHILPEIDDGSDCVETSRKMLEMLENQGVERIVATPHFRPHRYKNTEDFLEKRELAYQKLGSPENIILGAEIAVERGVSEIEGIEKLAFQNTDLILLEFPYTGYSSWMTEEIHNISVKYKLMPVIAHIHRYVGYYTKEQFENILKMKAIFQINNEAFRFFKERRFVKKLIKEEYPILFGSDSHNTDRRKPDWDLLKKKVKQPVIERSMELFENHLK